MTHSPSEVPSGEGMEAMLRETAWLVRKKLEKISFAHSLTRLKPLGGFPRGCCEGATFVLLYFLHEHRGIDPEILHYQARQIAERGVRHMWALVGRFHVDLTGDQFGGELRRDKVIVCKNMPWGGIDNSIADGPLLQLGLDAGYEDELRQVCQYLSDPRR